MPSLDTKKILYLALKKKSECHFSTMVLGVKHIQRKNIIHFSADILVFFQALKADLVPYLLKLLEGIGLENLESPSATKAQIVKALKAMTRSLQHGEQVSLNRGLGPEAMTGTSQPRVWTTNYPFTSAQALLTDVTLHQLLRQRMDLA